MAQLALYSCDICNKEHRRSDETSYLMIGRQIKVNSMWNHICFDCECAVQDLVKELRVKRENKPRELK